MAARHQYRNDDRTLLMVFLIQNSQNRDARAMHLKLDELLRAVPQARKEFMEVKT